VPSRASQSQAQSAARERAPSTGQTHGKFFCGFPLHELPNLVVCRTCKEAP
jgi:hypothetical protein